MVSGGNLSRDRPCVQFFERTKVGRKVTGYEFIWDLRSPSINITRRLCLCTFFFWRKSLKAFISSSKEYITPKEP